MDWTYFFGPSAFQLAAGFVIAKLFDLLSETRQDRRLRMQLAGEKDRLEIQHRDELRKRLFDRKFEAALRLARLLRGSAETLNTQMLLHAASYVEGNADVEMFRQLRDTTFDRVQAAIHEGFEAAADMEILFKGLAFGQLPHQSVLIAVNIKWRAFLRVEADFLAWLDIERQNLPPLLPIYEITAKNSEVSRRMGEMRDQTTELLKLTARYGESVSDSVRMLSEALEV